MRNWVLRTRQRPGFSNSVHKVGKYDARVAQVPLAFFFQQACFKRTGKGEPSTEASWPPLCGVEVFYRGLKSARYATVG